MAPGACRTPHNPSPQDTLRKIELCLEQGITTFDDADIYGGYRCEALFGQALKLKPALRSQIQLVSKCDIMLLSPAYPARRVKHYDTSAVHIRHSVEQSLTRLGVERLDVLLIHRPDPFMDAGRKPGALSGTPWCRGASIGAAGVSEVQALRIWIAAVGHGARRWRPTGSRSRACLERSCFPGWHLGPVPAAAPDSDGRLVAAGRRRLVRRAVAAARRRAGLAAASAERPGRA